MCPKKPNSKQSPTVPTDGSISPAPDGRLTADYVSKKAAQDEICQKHSSGQKRPGQGTKGRWMEGPRECWEVLEGVGDAQSEVEAGK